MPPILARMLVKLALSKNGRAVLVAALLGLIAIPLLFWGVVAGAVAAIFGVSGGGGTGLPPSSRLGLWLPVVQSATGPAGIPPAVELGLFSYASGGVWTATQTLTSSTTAAGLAQVPSTDWTRFGLTQNPYSPSANVAAGTALLAADLAKYPDNVSAALDAYLPGSANKVLQAAQGLNAGPTLGVWPLGGTDGRQGWQAPGIPDAGHITFIVSGFAPLGTVTRWDGQFWRGLLSPNSVTASAPLTPCADAPAGLSQLLPPDAACWYASVVATPGQSVTFTANAIWRPAVPSSTSARPSAGQGGPSGSQGHLSPPAPVIAQQTLTVTLTTGEASSS